ncbi:MAG TPA: hypothetical protein VFY85_11035 [Gemmatimonadaceae bacterium]|nr:hypothetical protein [Gemmatimonadaceae bacterium]
MSTESQIAATREELAAVRSRMSDTVAEIEARVTAPVEMARERVGAVKDRLDVVELIRNHPWPALAVALGAGVAVAASGADRKAASAAADASRIAAKKGAEAVKSGAQSLKTAAADAADSGAEHARQAPSRARGAIVGALDSLAAKAVVSLIDRLREPAPLPVTREPSGLGYVESSTEAVAP